MKINDQLRPIRPLITNNGKKQRSKEFNYYFTKQKKKTYHPTIPIFGAIILRLSSFSFKSNSQNEYGFEFEYRIYNLGRFEKKNIDCIKSTTTNINRIERFDKKQKQKPKIIQEENKFGMKKKPRFSKNQVNNNNNNVQNKSNFVRAQNPNLKISIHRRLVCLSLQ